MGPWVITQDYPHQSYLRITISPEMSQTKTEKIEAKIKARDKYLTCPFLSGRDNLRYKQLRTVLNNNYIMGMNGNPCYLPGFINLLKIYLIEWIK